VQVVAIDRCGDEVRLPWIDRDIEHAELPRGRRACGHEDASRAGQAGEARLRAAIEIDVLRAMTRDQPAQLGIDRIAGFAARRIGIVLHVRREVAPENGVEQRNAALEFFRQPDHREVFRREPADQLRLRIRGGVPSDEIFQRHPGGAEIAHRRMVDIRQAAQELVVGHRLLERIAEEGDEIGRRKQPGEFLRHEVAVDHVESFQQLGAARAHPRGVDGAARVRLGRPVSGPVLVVVHEARAEFALQRRPERGPGRLGHVDGNDHGSTCPTGGRLRVPRCRST
jgi:hypothetical protein